MRTDPTLKWLLNERAALAGKLTQQRRELAQQRKTVARHLAAADQAASRAAGLEAQLPSVQVKIRALDETMRLLSTQVDPAAAGVVNAWAGRYGERGALTHFLRDKVREAAPRSVSLASLLRAVEHQFELSFDTGYSRGKLRDSLRTCLRQLRDREGSIINLPASPANPQTSWQWKQPPSLEELRKAALPPLTVEAHDDLGSNENTLGGEMGGE